MAQENMLVRYGITITVNYNVQTDSYQIIANRGDRSYVMEVSAIVVEDSIKPVLESARDQILYELVYKK